MIKGMNGSNIVERFGGVRPLARLLGIPPSTVQHWKKTGRISPKHLDVLLRCGQALKPPLKPADFFERAA